MSPDDTTTTTTTTPKPIILHIGDPIQHNPAIYARLATHFTILRPEAHERTRPAFSHALRTHKWGSFSAILRPFWNTGGEMGRWDADLISLLPSSCRIFASAGAGYDWADVDVLAAHGVLYCNGAQASTEAVADAALWHVLSVFRNMAWSGLAARSADPEAWWDAHRRVGLTAHNPRGHVLGIVGLGNIGSEIARKVGAALGMRVCYFDIVRKTEEHEREVGATFVDSLEGLLGMADCVVLATPGGKTLIDKERLAQFKKGARFVNVARGSLVDEDALLEALKSGHIFAAGLDVFQNEPNVHPELIKMWNVTVTSHTAGGALETNYGFERLAMENIESFLLHGKALTPVNADLIGK